MKHKLATVLVLLLFVLFLALLCKPRRTARGNDQQPVATPFAQFMPVVLQRQTVTQTDGVASWSSPLVVAPDGKTVWVTSPDAGSISLIDTVRLTTTAELAVGQEPWALAITPNGDTIYVADRATGTLSGIDLLSQTTVVTLSLGYELGGLALSPSGEIAYITSAATDEIVVVDLPTQQVVRRIAVDYMPYAIAVSDDGDGQDNDERLYVTHLFARQRVGGIEATDDSREGLITIIDLASSTLLTTTTLPPDVTGFPNLLTSITVIGNQAWVPYVRAAPALPNGLTTRVFAAVSLLDTTTQQEDLAAYLPLNDQDLFGSPVNNPVAAIPASDGRRLYIVLAGSDLVEVVNIAVPHQPKLEKFIAVGKNPRGMAIDPTGARGYVMNYLSRSVSVLDLASLSVVAEIPTTAETLTPAVLRGKILFNNAVNPKLSQGSWISCASCHPDGGTDSVTWIFPDGPRQTPPLWNATQTLPWHWSAALDEAQDVEETIHLIQLGLGLAPGVDPPQLGEHNAGRATDLDALATFMQQGIRTPNVPIAEVTEEGRRLFATLGCVACHGGSNWTISALPGSPGTLDPDGNGMIDSLLREVGTLDARDIRGATGFDVPALLGVRLSAPYLHNGSAATLRALVASGHPTPGTAQVELTSSEVAALVIFLQSIGPTTAPFIGNLPVEQSILN